MSEREAKFEAMLQAVLAEYDNTTAKMEKLRADGKVKSATFRQLMGTKLTLQSILARYKVYGLLD
jgi:hypothetical protein